MLPAKWWLLVSIRGQAIGKRIDFRTGSLFRDGYQEAIGEFRIPAPQRHARQEAGLCRLR